MAESNGQSEKLNTETKQTKQEKLKYMEFVHVAAIQALVCMSRLYDFAKENAGPLKPGVQTVEGTVKTVMGPVYEKFQDLPLHLLKFVDRKVGDVLSTVESHIPSSIKEASNQAYSTVQKAPSVARSISDAGIVNTASDLAKTAYSKAEPVAKDLYTKYEPVAESYAVSAWKSLNRLPVFPQVAQIVVPTAAHWSQKYNKVVMHSAKKGYGIAEYLPLVPIEKIAKVFGEEDQNAAAAVSQ